MSDRTISLEIALIEGVHLRRLVDDFRELLQESDPDEDPALQRLTPDAYPDDAEASADFSDGTRSDLMERRLNDAGTVIHALNGFPTDLDGLDDAQSLAQRPIVVAERDIDSWLRTLTAVRLVLASRLGMETDADHDAEDPRFGVFDWLGYRLEGLIQAADQLLD
ncbi:MAG: DUF2017 family protein [Actinomycetota bacterium]